MRTYKFKLYYSKRNRRRLGSSVDLAGVIWNHCIALHRRYYCLFGKHLDVNALKKHITKLKRLGKHASWNELGSQAIQDIPERIDRAYNLYFSNRKRGVKASPPKFRKISRYSSFTLKQTGWKFVDGNHLMIMGKKYGYSKSREIAGKVKTVTVKRDAVGDFWVFFVTDEEVKPVPVAPGKSGGLDFGLKTFLVDQDGKSIMSPRPLFQALAELKRKSRNVSRKRKGTKENPESGRRRKARQELARLHRRIADRRDDFHHKTARSLSLEHRILAVENLSLKGMKRLWGQKVSDLGHGAFLRKLEWHCRKNGCQLVKVDRFYPSSKTCSCCGHVLAELDLGTREWTCPSCGSRHDRDVNAAINIARVGASTLGEGSVRPKRGDPAKFPLGRLAPLIPESHGL